MKTIIDPHYSQYIRSFYDETLWIVANFWTDQRVLATHVGYWETNTRNDREAQLNMNRILAERVKVQPGEHVLDAGCGMGGSALWLAENQGARVSGITLSPMQAQLASRAARRRHLSDYVSFSLQDYTATTFPNATFDVVWAVESVCYASTTLAFFKEAFRVLRPGGRLIMSDGFRRAYGYVEADEQLMRFWLEGWALPDLDTPDEFVSAAYSSGFSKVCFEDVTARLHPSIERLHRLSHLGAPVCSALSRLGLISPVVARAMWSNDATYDVFSRGLAVSGILRAEKPL